MLGAKNKGEGVRLYYKLVLQVVGSVVVHGRQKIGENFCSFGVRLQHLES